MILCKCEWDFQTGPKWLVLLFSFVCFYRTKVLLSWNRVFTRLLDSPILVKYFSLPLGLNSPFDLSFYFILLTCIQFISNLNNNPSINVLNLTIDKSVVFLIIDYVALVFSSRIKDGLLIWEGNISKQTAVHKLFLDWILLFNRVWIQTILWTQKKFKITNISAIFHFDLYSFFVEFLSESTYQEGFRQLSFSSNILIETKSFVIKITINNWQRRVHFLVVQTPI